MSRRIKEGAAHQTMSSDKGDKALPLLIATIVVVAGIGAAAYFLMSSPPSGGVDYESSGTGGSTTNGNPIATMYVRSADGKIDGAIKIELYRDKAPVTVDNFIRYARDGFYDGLIFHRVIKNFVAQGGGFYYDSSGNLQYKTPTYEPIINEANNGLSNVKGTIAMARTNDPNSATSQFYFNLQDNTNLDYQDENNPGYCVFGRVVGGWTVIEEIANIETTTVSGLSDVPSIPIVIQSVEISGA